MEVYNHKNLNLKSSKRQSFLMMLIIIYSLAVPVTNSATFDNTTFVFPSFDPNVNDIDFEGAAHPDSGVIQLTANRRDKSLNGSTGRVTYKELMHLWDKASGHLADFTTKFSFVIESVNTSTGDGFAFFLASNDSRNDYHWGGGYLGLASDNHCPFVAVEFDTFSNEWDPVGVLNHVGIDINSTSSVDFVNWWWIDIENGGKVDAWISYNSSSNNLSVYIVDGNPDDHSYIRNSSNLSHIIDLRCYLPEWVTFGFSGATGNAVELHMIYSWDFNSSLQVENISHLARTPVQPPKPSEPPRRTRSIKKWLWVVLAAVGLASILAGLVWFYCWKKGNKGREEGNSTVNLEVEMRRLSGPRKFSYKELVIATNQFAEEGLLGEGGFGKVYSGFLKDINSNVAVKKIIPQSYQGIKEYLSELQTISQLRHRNLVQLIGWCHEKQELIIVYEFVPNGSLDFHLFKEQCSLTWEKRHSIALGLASALCYLQEEWEKCVLHRDIKSSNVLLDSNFNVKLGDFGLARLVDHGQESNTTSILIGTEGYVAPEYHHSSRASKESDVYSFGIVTLELACGKKAIQEFERNGKKFRTKLVEWVWGHYGSGNIHAAADPRLCQNYDGEQMERMIVVGLACAHPNQYDRPSIRQAIDMLNFKAPVPLLPPEMPVPTFVAKPFSHVDAPGSTSDEIGRTQFSSSSLNTASSEITPSLNAPDPTSGLTNTAG